MSKVSINPVRTRSDVKAWLKVPQQVFADDASYVPPLHLQERRRIDRARNPYFNYSDVELLVAKLNGVPVGRISVQINRRYMAYHNRSVGHFGFYDVIDNCEVAAALLAASSSWLLERGVRRIEGPFSFSINEECGLLVHGFGSPATMMMPQSRPWYASQLETNGFESVMDLYAYRARSFELPEKFQWLAEATGNNPRIKVRPVERRHLNAEIALMIDIFNDAWSSNWGFVPLTLPELQYMMHGLLPFFRGHYGKFILLDDYPVGFIVVLPDVNTMIAEFGGSLWPLNWARLFYRFVREHYAAGRMPLLGLRRKHHGSLLGSQLFARLLREHMRDFEPHLAKYVKRTGKKGGFVELSWVLQSNRPLVTFLNSAFGHPDKTYRIYGKDL